MNSIIKKIVAAVVTVSLCSFGMAKASENETGVKFAVQSDLVSSYIWRGMYQTGASFQPTLAFSVAGFSLTAWGSTDFDGYRSSEGLANKEIDLTAAYTFGASGLTLLISGGRDKAPTSILISRAMKLPIISRRGLPTLSRLKSSLCRWLGTRCSPDRIRMPKATRTILPTLN